MTESPRTAPLAFETLDDVAAAIRSSGGRLSAARRMILEELFAADAPVSAERIADGLAARGLTRPRLDLPQPGAPRGAWRRPPRAFRPRTGSLLPPCPRRARIPGLRALRQRDQRRAARLDEVRALVERTFGYRARFTHFPITGLCPACAAEGDAAGGPASTPTSTATATTSTRTPTPTPTGAGTATRRPASLSPCPRAARRARPGRAARRAAAAARPGRPGGRRAAGR